MLGSKDLDPAIRMRMDAIDRDFRDRTSSVQKIPSINCPDELPAELRGEVESLNDRRSSLIQRFREMVQPVFRVLGKLGSPSEDNPPMGELLAAVDSVKDARMMELEEAAKIAQAGRELTPRVVAVLEPNAKELEETYQKTLETVKEDLERIGQGVLATQTSRRGGGGEAAKRAFNYLANLNDRSVAAFVLAHDAGVRLRSMKTKEGEFASAAEGIQTHLTRLAVSELRI